MINTEHESLGMKMGGPRNAAGLPHQPHPPGQQPMMPTPPQPPNMVPVKQEGSAGNDLMVPGQTHLGSPDTVPPYVDSTTFPSGPTPPKSTDNYAQELRNGTTNLQH